LSEIVKGKRLDFTVVDVNEVYDGPAGMFWEMLMGEEIHVGGKMETGILAEKAGVDRNTTVLDVCSALGGPARNLAKKYGCRVTGLDATKRMVDEAVSRTEKEGLMRLVAYRLGNALDMPFRAGTFDVVWGQDAWCYITDKERLIKEAYKVLKPGGIIAFTDWVQVGNMTDKEWKELNNFMVFPYMETLDGYEHLLKENGFKVLEKEDLSNDFTLHCHIYQDRLRNELKNMIIEQYGNELFDAADDGLDKWVRAADEGKVGRGRLIGRKMQETGHRNMNVVVIMAKAPFPNEAKTRLTPPLEPEMASHLYHSFLLDKIEQVKRIEGVYPFIAYTPETAEAFFQEIRPSGFSLIAQSGVDLGERLANTSESLFEQGFEKLVMLDSDTPNLPPEYIREGLKRLDKADVVLGPCEDGGYYLIGMRASQPQLFKGIPWSTSRVMDLTVENANSLGLVVSLLDRWYDIDTIEDLWRLKYDLGSASRQKGGFFCENTCRAIFLVKLD
jgi:rSAM/selenodomain-associated transferase 1